MGLQDQTNPFFDPPEKKRVHFTRSIFALALLKHQTLHLQNKLFSP